MAQVVRIIFKLQQEGEKLLKSIPEGLQNVNKAIKQTSAIPLEAVSNAIKRIDENTRSAAGSLTNIEGAFKRVFSSIVQQSKRALDESTNNATKIAGRSLEKTLTVAAGIGTALQVTNTKIFQSFQVGLSGVNGIAAKAVFSAGALGEAVESVATGAFGLLSNRITAVKSIFDGFFANTIGSLGLVAGLTTTLTASFFGFIALRSVFGELTLFFRRLRGQGLEALTPLERLTRLITTLDLGINQMGVTAGQVVKTASLGLVQVSSLIFPVINPLLVTIPFLNSLVSTLFNTFQRRLLGTAAFFGSSQARIRLIFLDLKEIAQKALPILLNRVKELSTFWGGDALNKQAQAANAEIQKMAKGVANVNAEGSKISFLQAIARRTQPIGVQIQGFVVTIKEFLTNLIAQSDKIFQVMTRGFGLSKTEIKGIEQSAGRTADGILSKVNKTEQAFDAIFQKKSLSKALTDAFGAVAKFDISGIGSKIIGGIRKAFSGGSNLSQAFLAANSFGKQKSQIIPDQEVSKVRQLNSGVQLLNNSFSRMTGELTKMRQLLLIFASALTAVFSPTIADEFNSDLKTTGSATAVLTKNVQAVAKVSFETATGIKKEVGGIIAQVFDLSTMTKKLSAEILTNKAGKGSTVQFKEKLFGDKSSTLSLQVFIQDIEKLSRGEGKIESIQKNLKGLFSLLGSLSSEKFGRKLDLGAIFKFSEDPKFLNAPKNLEAFRKSFEEFAKSLGVEGTKASSAFIKKLNSDLREGKSITEIQNSLLKLLDVFLQMLPQSPAKAGPLKNLPKMGLEIVRQLAQGMQRGHKDIDKSAGDVAERVAKHFPRSPALLGPLVALPKMGLSIVMQLAQGMRSGLSLIADTASSIGKAVFDNISRASEQKLFAERFGISVEVLSSFNLALADVGASSQDLEFTLTGLNRVLGQTLTGEESEKFKRLGIDIEKARAANEPNVALFYQLSDALHGLPPQSEKFQKTLEALGITGQSKIVNVLLKGSDELKRFQGLAVETGTVTSSKLSELSREFIGLFNRFDETKKTILNGLVEELLPKVNETFKEFVSLFEKNQQVIQGILRLAGQAIGRLVELVGNFVQLIITEPRRGFELVSRLFFSFADVAVTVFNIVFAEIGNKFGEFFDFLGEATLVGIKKIGSLGIKGIANFGLDILVALGTLVQDIFLGVYDFFAEGVGNFIQYAKDLMFQSVSGLIIGISDVIKNTGVPGVETLGKKLGLVLSDDEVSDLSTKLDQIEKRSFSLLDIATKAGEKTKEAIVLVVSGYEVSTKDLEAKSKRLFNNLIGEESKSKFKESLTSLKDTALGAVQEIADFKITNSDLTKSFFEVGDLFREKIGGAVESVFGDESKNKVNAFFDSVLTSAKNVLEPVTSVFTRIGEMIEQTKAKTKEIIFGADQPKGQGPEGSGSEFSGDTSGLFMTDPRGDKKEDKLFGSFDSEREKAAEEEKKKQEALATAIQHAYTTSFDLIGQAMQKMYEQGGKHAKKYFIAMKALAVGEAIINGVVAVSKALREVPTPGNYIEAAAQAALAAANVATIVATAVQGFAQGGPVSGPSGTDVIPARLTAGEYVQPTNAVNYYGVQAMEAIRSRLLPRDFAIRAAGRLPSLITSPPSLRFNEGGMVPSQAIENSKSAQGAGKNETVVNLENINVVDPNLVARYLSSNKGKTQIKNIISDDAEGYRKVLRVR